jgi:hypothetical protein
VKSDLEGQATKAATEAKSCSNLLAQVQTELDQQKSAAADATSCKASLATVSVMVVWLVNLCNLLQLAPSNGACCAVADSAALCNFAKASWQGRCRGRGLLAKSSKNILWWCKTFIAEGVYLSC